MNIRKELYMTFFYAAEKSARDAQKQLELNKTEIKRLVKEQQRLKHVRNTAHRVYAEMKSKVNTCPEPKKKV